MSWTNCRGTIVSSIEALTPTTRSAEFPYRNIRDGFPEERAVERGFDVRLRSGPAQVGQIINGSSWRWLTDFEVVLWYAAMPRRADLEQMLEEDARQIQQTLLQLGNHHANAEGIVPQGEGLASVTVDYQEDGSCELSIGFTLHHL